MQIYKVGGWVRDRLLGITPSDCDYVVVGSTVDEMLKLGFKPVGRDFPVFLHPITNEEYALARTERKTSLCYHGFSFYTNPDVTLHQDLARRDLTINAMALDELDNVIDPFGGKLDLEKKIIRHISTSFSEDPLRVIRAARFCAQLDFTIAFSTMRLMKICAIELTHISKERISIELHKGLDNNQPMKFLKALHIAKALNVISPNLAKCMNDSPFKTKLHYLLDKLHDVHEKLAIISYLLNNDESLQKLMHHESNEMSKLLVMNYTKIVQLHTLPADIILTLITNLDYRRKPQRYQMFVRLSNLIAEGNSHKNDDISKNLEKLTQITQQINLLNWEQICGSIDGIQNKIAHFKQYQLDIIDKFCNINTQW